MIEDANGRKYYKTVDGNYSRYTVAFCTYYGRSLTPKLINTHRCIEKKCKRFLKVESEYWNNLERQKEEIKERRNLRKQKEKEIKSALNSREWKRLLNIK